MATKKQNGEEHQHHENEVICFTSHGRETCIHVSQLEHIFKRGTTREVSSWTIMKIMGEFTQGFDFLKRFKKSISIMGSARMGLEHQIYQEATDLAFKLAKAGFAVITGGGPGIMEAANKGAFEAGGQSLGLNIKLPKEQTQNAYTTASLDFSYFFARRTALSYAAEAYIFFPGGFGTLDEFFEIITLVQTHKIKRIPIFLVGSDFWNPLDEFIREHLLRIHQTIIRGDLDLYVVTDDEDTIIEGIRKAPISDGVPHHRISRLPN